VPPGYVSGNQIKGRAAFANKTVFDIFGADAFSSKVFDDGVNAVIFTSVPEPATALLGALGVGLLLFHHRRYAVQDRDDIAG